MPQVAGDTPEDCLDIGVRSLKDLHEMAGQAQQMSGNADRLVPGSCRRDDRPYG